MDLATYRRLRTRARLLSRRAADVDDLVQDTLLAALEAGRYEPAWLEGVMKNRAAMTARGQARRHRRELASAESGDAGLAVEPEAEGQVRASLLRSLPPSARWLAGLAGIGTHNRRPPPKPLKCRRAFRPDAF